MNTVDLNTGNGGHQRIICYLLTMYQAVEILSIEKIKETASTTCEAYVLVMEMYNEHAKTGTLHIKRC